MWNHHQMCHLGRTALTLWALWAFASPEAWAAASDAEHATGARVLVVVLTVIGGLGVALLLYKLAQQTSRVRYKEQGKSAAGRPRGPAAAGKKTLVPAIVHELKRLPGSGKQHQDVAQTVSALVTETVADEVDTVRQELGEHYGKLIEERQRNEAILQRKYQATLSDQKQTTAVLESIAEGLVVVNTKGEVVMMNPAAKGLLEINEKGRVGRPLLESVGDKQLVSLVQGTNDQKDKEIVVSAKEESTKRVLRASNAVITDESGNTVGMVSVLSDVTKQREIDDLKAEFVSKVSHELRTPIVAMQHALAILSDQVAGALSEEQQKFVSLSQRNLERLNNLINDLLDLSKLEAKKMELRLQPGAIAPVIQQVCETLEPWAKSKAIALTPRLSDGLPNALFDQTRITQVLTNLVGNAIKCTPKQGRIVIEARRAEEALEVSVTDSGSGIAKEDIPKLFSKFQQVGERRATDISGTGLGLAISKEIVELHKGQIWADPEARQGARFVFTLPLAPSPTPE